MSCCNYHITSILSQLASDLLSPLTAWGLLLNSLFEVIDGGGHHEFAELTVPRTKVDRGVEPTLDVQKDGSSYLALSV